MPSSFVFAFSIGTLVGFLLAIPPGPIGLASIRLGVKSGMRSVVQLALGAGLMDLLYCLFSMWASSGVLKVLLPSVAELSNPSISPALQLTVSAGMVTAGAVLYRTTSKPLRGSDESTVSNSASWLRKIILAAVGMPFLLGVGFAITNLANPTFIPSLVVVTGLVQSMHLVTGVMSDIVGFSLGFGVGNALWLVTLGFVVTRYRHRMSDRVLDRIKSLMALFLVLAGVYYAVSITVQHFA